MEAVRDSSTVFWRAGHGLRHSTQLRLCFVELLEPPFKMSEQSSTVASHARQTTSSTRQVFAEEGPAA